MTNARPIPSVNAGRAEYQKQRTRHTRPQRPVVTDAAALHANPAEAGRARWAAEHGDTDAAQALAIFDVQRDRQIRARYAPNQPDTATDDEELRALARSVLDDLDGTDGPGAA